MARPVPPFDQAKARQLLADAGVVAGFDVGTITPLPPYFSWAERVASQLRAVGIRTNVNQLERATFYEKLAPGPDRLKGFILQFAGAPGDAASRLRALCNGSFSGLCSDEVDSRMKRYGSSTDDKERQTLLTDVQTYLLDNYLMVPMPRNVVLNVAGPRLATTPTGVIGAIPQYPFAGPYEDIQVTD